MYGDLGTAWLRTERGLLAYALASDDGPAWQAPELPTAEYGARQHTHVLAMLRRVAPIDTSARDGVRALQVVEAIERSARTAKWTAVMS